MATSNPTCYAREVKLGNKVEHYHGFNLNFLSHNERSSGNKDNGKLIRSLQLWHLQKGCNVFLGKPVALTTEGTKAVIKAT